MAKIEKVKADDRLIEIIKADEKLDDAQRFEYITLAQSFIEDFKGNMMLTSIELDAKYSFGIDVWQEFLSHPPIKKYINSFVNEMIAKNTDTALATGVGVRDAIGVKRAMSEATQESRNENFVVFRLPDKNEDEYQLSGEIS